MIPAGTAIAAQVSTTSTTKWPKADAATRVLSQTQLVAKFGGDNAVAAVFSPDSSGGDPGRGVVVQAREALSSDGGEVYGWLASVNKRDQPHLMRVHTATGQRMQDYRTAQGYVGAASFPDRSMLAFGLHAADDAHMLELLDVEDGSVGKTYHINADPTGLSWDAENRLLAANSGTVTSVIDTHAGTVASFAGMHVCGNCPISSNGTMYYAPMRTDGIVASDPFARSMLR